MYNPIAIVSSDNIPIGTVTDVVSVLPEGQYRSASSVFVFNEKGQILLQKRSIHILSPGLLDKSVGGHVDAGETNEEAAIREMSEELGITDIPLTLAVGAHRFEGYCVSVYKAAIHSDAKIKFDQFEIDEVLWVSPEELTEKVTKEPEMFTRNLVDVWLRHRDTLLA